MQKSSSIIKDSNLVDLEWGPMDLFLEDLFFKCTLQFDSGVFFSWTSVWESVEKMKRTLH